VNRRLAAALVALALLAGTARAQHPIGDDDESSGDAGGAASGDTGDQATGEAGDHATGDTAGEAAPAPTTEGDGKSIFDDLPPEATRTQPVRKKDASWEEIFSGPFRTSRLYAMPIAEVIGAYQLSISGDGSLLQERGVLSSAGVVAIGFGDIAQLEYRHTGVIGAGHGSAPIPAVGVQLKAPLPERPGIPALAVALRLGVSRPEEVGGVTIDEKVTDLYLVGRLELWGALDRFALHGALRVASAKMILGGETIDRRLYLPAGGWNVRLNDRTRFVGEAALVPLFRVDSNMPVPATAKIKSGVLGRLGVRWYALPWMTFDASVGYQVEVARLSGAASSDPTGVVEWDIRLGTEVFLPWGAIACRAAGVFCE